MPPTVAKDPACKVDCPKCGSKAGFKCVNYLNKGKQICNERLEKFILDQPEPVVHSGPAPKIIHDEPEPKPAPVARKEGEPIPHLVRVPSGEVERWFAAWVDEGRIPAGCVLTKFVGTTADQKQLGNSYSARHSGFERMDGGKPIPADEIEAFQVRVTIREERTFNTYAVLEPAESNEQARKARKKAQAIAPAAAG